MTDQASPAAAVASTELACLDGRVSLTGETFIPVTDDGFIRGDGVFEVVRVYHGRPFALGDHLDRLERSAANLRLGEGVPRADFEAEARELLAARGGAEFDGCLRLILTRGGRRLLLTEPLPPGAERPRLGFVPYAPTRVLDGIKSLSYAANMLAGRLAKERGFDEGLFVTPEGQVLEGATWTFFWVSDGQLLTPPLGDHILDSITRRLVIEGSGAIERGCTLEDLRGAEEAFIASSAREVQPISAIDDIELPSAPGPVTEAAHATLVARIEDEVRTAAAAAVS